MRWWMKRKVELFEKPCVVDWIMKGVSWSSCPRRRISDHWRGKRCAWTMRWSHCVEDSHRWSHSALKTTMRWSHSASKTAWAEVILRWKQPCAEGHFASKTEQSLCVEVGGVEGAMRWVWMTAEGVRVGCVMSALRWSKNEDPARQPAFEG